MDFFKASIKRDNLENYIDFLWNFVGMKMKSIFLLTITQDIRSIPRDFDNE